MKSLRLVDLTDLEDGSLVIIDTEDKSYKIAIHMGVLDEETLDFRTHLLSVIDEDIEPPNDNESEPKSVIISHVKVGKSMLIVEAPTRNNNNMLELGSSSHTSKVTNIEVYEAV